MSAYDMDPDQVLTLLCIGVTHLNQAVSRKVPDRDAAVLATFAFLQVPPTLHPIPLGRMINYT